MFQIPMVRIADFKIDPRPRPTLQQVRHHRRVMHAVDRAYAPGREDRIAKAQAKRDRKNAKLARDARAAP